MSGVHVVSLLIDNGRIIHVCNNNLYGCQKRVSLCQCT